jgi:hypothetical protein
MQGLGRRIARRIASVVARPPRLEGTFFIMCEIGLEGIFAAIKDRHRELL